MITSFYEKDVFRLPFNEEILNKSITSSIKKFSNTTPNLMYRRTPVELLDNILMGDIAKNSLFFYLQEKSSMLFIDYDEIREDKFINSDPGWDIKIGSSNKKIEVKSSIPTRFESYQNIISLRDIKITAGHSYITINPNDLVADYFFQIYFYAKIYKKGYESIHKLQEDLDKKPQIIHELLNTKKYSSPLFFSWNSKINIVNFSEELTPPTWSWPASKRIYWKCPIKFSYSLPDFFNEVEQI